jgi:hypothetical protein
MYSISGRHDRTLISAISGVVFLSTNVWVEGAFIVLYGSSGMCESGWARWFVKVRLLERSLLTRDPTRVLWFLWKYFFT